MYEDEYEEIKPEDTAKQPEETNPGYVDHTSADIPLSQQIYSRYGSTSRTGGSAYTGSTSQTGSSAYTGSTSQTGGSTYTGSTSQTGSSYYTGGTSQAGSTYYSRYANPTPPPADPHVNQANAPKKKGKGGLALALVAILMVGVLAGSGVSYAYLNSRINNMQDQISSQSSKGEPNNILDFTDRIELNRNDKPDDAKSNTAHDIRSTYTGEDMSVADIVANNLSSVVAITNYGVTEIRTMWGNFKQDSKSAGSGVIIGQTDSELLILTNYHVVADSQTLSVVFSWEEDDEDIDEDNIINGEIKDYDSSRDIAVIAIKIDDLTNDTLEKISIATIGSSDDLVLGEQVVVVGNALGYGQSVTTGIVSALNRKIGSADEYGRMDPNPYIQTDAAINPGNSGGAMFNMRGELVGINSSKIGGTNVDSVGYAIPISDVASEIEDMMNQQSRDTLSLDERGWLGVSIVDVTEDISLTYGLPVGIYVSAIASGSGAEKAGIQKEDVITAINGRTLTTGEDLKEYLSKYSVGETVTLTVYRDGPDGYAPMEIDVELGENPDQSVN